jgi:hypothetical protein
VKVIEVVGVPVIYTDVMNKSMSMMATVEVALTFNLHPALMSDGSKMILSGELKQAVERMMTKAINTK